MRCARGRRVCALASLLVLAIASAASAETVPPQGPTLEKIEAEEGAPVVVRLALSEHVEPKPFKLAAEGSTPARIVVDFPGTKLGLGVRQGTFGFGPLIRIRLGEAPATGARVVLDLTHPVEFRVDTQGEVVTITIEPSDDRAEAPKPGAASRTAAKTPMPRRAPKQPAGVSPRAAPPAR